MENSTFFRNAKSSRNPVLIAFEVGINAVMTAAAVVGNSLVCLVLYRSPSLRTVTNIFVLSLAIADLLTGVLVMPFNTIAIATGTWITGQVGCKLNYNVGNILGGTSVLTVTLMAFNRYIHLVRPGLYKMIFSKERAKKLAVCVWILQSLVVVASYLIWDKSQVFHGGSASCFQFFTKDGPSLLHLAKLVAYITLTAAVTGVCYARIHKAILRHNAAVAPPNQDQELGGGPHGVEERKITKMLFVVVFGFYLCWLPVFIYSIVDMIISIEEKYYRYYTLYVLFPVFTSSVFNPIVYSVLNRSFRKEFKKIILFQY